jgi:hypothetical protein
MKMEQPQIESITGSYEEIYQNYEVYISPNRDAYRGGYEWSVCKDETECETGLEFSIDDALNSAKLAIDRLLNK